MSHRQGADSGLFRCDDRLLAPPEASGNRPSLFCWTGVAARRQDKGMTWLLMVAAALLPFFDTDEGGPAHGVTIPLAPPSADACHRRYTIEDRALPAP